MKTYPIIGAQSNINLKTGLISCWEFNETSGLTAYDAHGSKNGTNSGADVDYTGKIDKAYNYVKNVGDKVSMPSGLFFGSDTFTISVWVKSNSIGTTQGIFTSWLIPNRMVLTRFSGSDLQFYTYTSAQVGGTFATISADTWYHLVFTYDGSEMRVWINNSLEETSYSQSGDIGEGSDTVTYVSNYITATGNEFSGLIDQLVVWNILLSETKIAALNNSGNGLPYSQW